METSSSRKIRLIQMQSRQEGLTMLYDLEFSDSVNSWTVTRRYSQLRRCHVTLLELFAVSELPHFPPKEPMFQKFLMTKKHDEFVHNRELELQNYVLGLLECPKLQQTLPVQELLSMPTSVFTNLESSDDVDDLGVAAFSGFRVLLTGDPGGLEVNVRAGTHADLSLRPSRVDLTLQELTEEQGEDPLSEGPSAHDVDTASLQRFEEVLDFEEDKASKRFSLRPGSFWEVSARGVTAAGVAGSAVAVRIRAPGEEEIANLPESALRTVERRAAAEANLCSSQEDAAQGRTLTLGELGERLPNTVLQVDENQPQELDVQQGSATLEPMLPTSQSSRNPMEYIIEGKLKNESPDLTAQESSQGKEPQEDIEVGPAQELALQHEAVESSSFVAERCSVGSSGVPVEATQMPELVEQQQSGAKEEKELEKDPIGDREAESVAKPKNRPTILSQASSTFPVQQRFQSSPDGCENQARSFTARRRLETAEEDHRVISARGNVAAAYMQNVQEKQQMAIEKAPHRFEKVNGAVSSVPLKFSAIGASATEAISGLREEAEVLDQKRHEQEMRDLQENERKAARWIFAVTGHPDMGDAVAGKITFQAAIQSGEALCDLINAIWPGRITGILRGDVKKMRRVENAQKFCNVCKEVGVDDAHIFAPAELAVGKIDRSVTHCLFDLSTVIPAPPEYEGPRIGDDFNSSFVSEFHED